MTFTSKGFAARFRLLLACLLVLYASPLPAQRTTADIVGTVRDASGAVVPGVAVNARNAATGAEWSAVTDDAGNYVVTLLPIGVYRITVTHPGFKTWSASEVTLAVGDRLRLDVRLEVGATAESIEIVASSPALQSDSSTLGNLITQRAVQDLPISGRNFIALAQLAAGAHPGEANSLASGARPDDRRQTSAVSVSAQPSSSNNFLLDGMDNNERFIGTVIIKPSMDALAEMRVLTSLYSAELGRTAGGVVSFITKSGTNEFHGSLFEYFRNEKLDARNFFAGAVKPSYKQNQFGGSLGGPIRTNRTFFFTDYEGFRLRQGQTFVSTVPTAAMKAGNFSGVNAVFDPTSTRADSSSPTGWVRTRFPQDTIPLAYADTVGRRLAGLYPDPTASGRANNYTLSPLRTQRNDTFDARTDHNLTGRDMMFVRYSFNNTKTDTPGAFPADPSGIHPVGDTGFSGTATQRAQGALMSYVRTFSPRLVMELKSGFSRFTVYSLPFNYGVNANEQLGIKGTNVDLVSSGLSNISVSGYRGLGDANFVPLITINNLFQQVVNLTYMQGSHSLRFGADLRRRQLTPFQSASPKGQFSFDGNLTNDPSGLVSGSGNAVASLMMGFPASSTRSKYLVWPGLRLWEAAAYIQDDWRATRWLTLNLGLRYDYYGPISEVADRISNVDLAGRKIIVAGLDGVSRSAGVQANWRDISPRFGFAATLLNGTVVRGGYAINFVPPFIGSPLAMRNPPFVSLYNVTATALAPANRMSEQLPPAVATDPRNPTGNLAGVALDSATPYVQQYNLTLQQELAQGFVASASYVGALGRRQFIFNGAVNLNQPTPGAGAIAPRRPYFSLFPNVSAINVAAPWYNTNYHGFQTTLERRYQAGFGVLATYTWAHSIDNTVQQVNNPRAERGNSFLDMRHRLTFMANYDLPFGRNGQGLVPALARGWRVNAIAALSTGLPFNVTNAAGRSNTGVSDRPDLTGNPHLPAGQRKVERWFNTAAFAAQPLYTFGNLARNALSSPGRRSLDLSVHREFRPTERARLQFRVEAFNVTNTPAFGTPGGSFGSAAFGVISSAGLPRNVQLALKLLF